MQNIVLSFVVNVITLCAWVTMYEQSHPSFSLAGG